jgi:hypothetical protein
MLFRQGLETIANAVEFLHFVQDGIGIHGVRGFLEKPKERELQMG